MAVGNRQTLPFQGIHLLLGNDLAGDKAVVNPLLTDTPCMDHSLDAIEQQLRSPIFTHHVQLLEQWQRKPY